MKQKLFYESPVLESFVISNKGIVAVSDYGAPGEPGGDLGGGDSYDL